MIYGNTVGGLLTPKELMLEDETGNKTRGIVVNNNKTSSDEPAKKLLIEGSLSPYLPNMEKSVQCPKYVKAHTSSNRTKIEITYYTHECSGNACSSYNKSYTA